MADVAALLRIARVQMAFDGDQARHTFQQALDEIRGLSGLGGEFLLEQARLLAAAVAPHLLREIPSVSPGSSRRRDSAGSCSNTNTGTRRTSM
jgi:hypothetical protein